MKVWNQLPSWLRDTLERAWWTFLGTFVVVSGYQTGTSLQLSHVDWLLTLDLSLGTTVFSTAKSAIVAHTKLGTEGTASAVKLQTSGRHARPDESAE